MTANGTTASIAMLGALMMATVAVPGKAAEKLTYHANAARAGWNAEEKVLTPAVVASDRFGFLWQSPQLDWVDGVPPRLFATPLYVPDLVLPNGHRVAAAFVATTAGYAYAISTARSGSIAPGDILWRQRLTSTPCAGGTMGNLSTPVIDRRRGRIYVSSCSGKDWIWHVHALDLRSGAQLPGWPVEISVATMNHPGLNHNGTTRFVPGQPYLQRGALNLSPDGTSLYVAFGPDFQGWLVALDTARPQIASAFSTNPVQEQEQGGMWGSSGPAVDAEGHVYIATGASFAYALAKRGIPGVFPDSPHSWGQSILQFADTPSNGLRLTGSYTPYNYCQTAASDIDIAGSGAVVIDVPGQTTATPHLLALGAGKQGNAYLLDRSHMPGGTVQRHACSSDPRTDLSLLAPEIQPVLKARGPLNIFGPFSDSIGMVNQAKSRSTLAHFRDRTGVNYLYFTGSTKTGADFSTNVPPGLVRVKIVTTPHRPAFLRLDGQERTITFQNPGSPVISSRGGSDAIVWVLDPNAPRSADPFLAGAVRPVLYAFDALSLRLLWTSKATLFPSGKYNEATVADGLVLVGTDRLQAFGVRGAMARAPAATPKSATPALSTPPLSGKEVFAGTCAACHGAVSGPAPALSVIAKFSKAQIVEILTTGKMQPMASGLSPAQIDQVAAFVSAGGQ